MNPLVFPQPNQVRPSNTRYAISIEVEQARNLTEQEKQFLEQSVVETFGYVPTQMKLEHQVHNGRFLWVASAYGPNDLHQTGPRNPQQLTPEELSGLAFYRMPDGTWAMPLNQQ